MRTRIMAAALACALLFLCACGRSVEVSSGDDGTNAVTANFTNLGTRASVARAQTPITNNADAVWSDYNPPADYPGMVTQATQWITMPDGTRLAAYLTLPADGSGKAASGRFPTMLLQTGYNGGIDMYLGSTGQGFGAANPYFVQHGYAVLVVDVRGTGQSEGSWDAFGAAEQSDYGNVVEWVTQQRWSNGSIGLFGGSYLGITAILTAAQGHPAVKAAFPVIPIGDGYRDIVFTGGQVNPTFIPIWLSLVSVLGLPIPALISDPSIGLAVLLQHLESAIMNFQVPILLRSFAGNPAYAYDSSAADSFWALRSPLESASKIRVPTFIVGGLHDLFQRSEPLSYERIKTGATAKLLIGPWNHLQAGNGLPADGVPVLDHIVLQWFDQYVKGLDVDADKQPNVTQYVHGYGHYVTATDWPHPQVQAQRLYLHGDLSVSTNIPVAGGASNAILQQPLNGLCSISLEQWTAGATGLIPLPCQNDSTLAELLDLKYQTEPMSEDTYINGPIQADVWISTTANDAGLSVRIDDVDGSGNVTPLTNGIQTASLRAVDSARSRTMNGMMIQPWHPFTQASAEPLSSGAPTLVSVEIFPTSAMIAKGHRLRVAIGASNLPQGIPPVPTLLNTLIGVLSIYSDAAHPSSVVIPVVPSSALNQGAPPTH